MYIIILSPHILLYKISLRFQKKRFFSPLTLPKVKDTIFGDEERNFFFMLRRSSLLEEYVSVTL